MKDDLTGKIPLRKSLKNIKNMMACIYRIDKSYYFLCSLRLTLDAVGAALAVVYSADILELLCERGSGEALMRKVVLLLALPALFGIASRFLWEEWIDPGRKQIARVYDSNLAMKFQSMDYSLVNSPYVKEMQDRIDKVHNWSGGINDLFWEFDSIVSGLANLVCSVAVAFPILKIIVSSRNLWMYLGMAALLLLLWVMIEIRTRAQAAFQERLLKSPRDIYPEELYRKYYSCSRYWARRCMGGDYHFIKDIHLYNGYALMKRYTADNMREAEKAMPQVSVLEKLGGKEGFFHKGTESLMTLTGYHSRIP